MHAALAPTTFRGVLCQRCGKPSRVRQAILNRETSFNQSAPDLEHQWCSRVFSHRCRICGTEAVYALNHISEFEEAYSA